MLTRKLAGWCLIVWGAVKVFQAAHLYAGSGLEVGPLSAALISLLFASGAAFLCLDRAPWASWRTRAR